MKLSRKIPCVTRNAEGVEVKSFRKKHYFECELGPRGQGVLRQTHLSFSRTPATPTRTREGHDRVGASNISFSSTTVGQHARGAIQTAEQNTDGR